MKVVDLMKNMYGNYVIQTSLDVCNDQQKHKFIKYTRDYKDLLKKVRYGKHILNKVDEICKSKGLKKG